MNAKITSLYTEYPISKQKQPVLYKNSRKDHFTPFNKGAF